MKMVNLHNGILQDSEKRHAATFHNMFESRKCNKKKKPVIKNAWYMIPII